MMRFEIIRKGGVSSFSDELPSPLLSKLFPVIIDHQEKRVAVTNVPDIRFYADACAFSHISEAMRLRLADPKPFTWDEVQTTRTNSYERELMIPRFDLDSLIHMVEENIIPNLSRAVNSPACTYEESLIQHYVPAMLNKLKELREATKAA